MAVCEVCGNDYEKAFTITQGGRVGTYDSFECAIHGFAPSCSHCGCKVIGHGIEREKKLYCCSHCAGHGG
jgi:hypothetical protein